MLVGVKGEQGHAGPGVGYMGQVGVTGCSGQADGLVRIRVKRWCGPYL